MRTGGPCAQCRGTGYVFKDPYALTSGEMGLLSEELTPPRHDSQGDLAIAVVGTRAHETPGTASSEQLLERIRQFGIREGGLRARLSRLRAQRSAARRVLYKLRRETTLTGASAELLTTALVELDGDDQ